jgi:preprotein translocase subunit SecG
MSTFIVLIHVVVCIALILIVLLQTGKGADMGAAFGGGSSQTVFGSTGAGTFLSKMTTGAAVIFMLTSLSLAYFSSRGPSSSVMPAPTPPPVTQDTSGLPTETTAPAPIQSESAQTQGQAETVLPTPQPEVAQPAAEPASVPASEPASAQPASEAPEKG